MNPVIGIVSCSFENNRQFVTHSYIEAVARSGAAPVIIPYPSAVDAPEEYYAKYLQLCDGFLFCGGNDISPLLFGEQLLCENGITDWKTDLFQIRFMKYVLSYKLPVLGICRGMQVINIALGGSIFQDLSLRRQRSLVHMQSSLDRSDPCHQVYVRKGSILHKICGDSIAVNSFHHQSVKRTGDTLRICGVSPDGVIEALESEVFPFVLGLQWHPECMIDRDPSMEKIFFVFAEISRRMKKLQIL